MLIRAQNDIENLRQGQSDEASKWSRDLEAREKEIEKLKTLVNSLEKRLKDSDSQLLKSFNELQCSFSQQVKDIQTLQQDNTELEKTKEQLIARNRQLESDIKALRKESQNKEPPKTPARREYNEISSASFLVSSQNRHMCTLMALLIISVKSN